MEEPQPSMEQQGFDYEVYRREIPTEPLPNDGEIEVMDWEGSESSWGTDRSLYESKSGTLSFESLRYNCYVENGRKYPEDNPHRYWSPADEMQFESMFSGHMFFNILDSQLSNKLFRSPLGPNPKHIIDLGSGSGDWAIECAEMFPDCKVVGIDLNPPPTPMWLPGNCTLQVDDASKPWTWSDKFDLVHIRQMFGAFSYPEWERLYQQAYDALEPGGWIEQAELDPEIRCDDDSLPPDSVLRTIIPQVRIAAATLGNHIDVESTMRERIENAGFVNVQERQFKCPIGTWPRHPIYQDAGHFCWKHTKDGIEGWTMNLFTKFANPPWTTAEVQEWLGRVQIDLDKGYHIYHFARRVWAQKPFEELRSSATSVADSQMTAVEESLTDTETLYSVRRFGRDRA